MMIEVDPFRLVLGILFAYAMGAAYALWVVSEYKRG